MKNNRFTHQFERIVYLLMLSSLILSQFLGMVKPVSAAGMKDDLPTSISGTINDAGGSPLTGVSVQVRAVLKSDGSEAASTTTNPANGTYTLTGLPLETALAVVASDEDPDTDGYPGRYYDNVSNLEWAESIVLTSGSPDRSGVNINLSTGGVTAEQLTFNTREGRLLSDINIRQAIAYGTDRKTIFNDAFYPNGETGVILHSLVMPGLWYKAATSDPLLTVYTYDPKEADNILETAGWIDTNADGIREYTDGTRLELEFVTTIAPRRVASAELFTKQMADIGIEVNVKTFSSSDFFSGDPARSPLNSGDFDIAEFAWGLGDDDALPGVYTTGNEQNFGGYSNSNLDGYFNAARAAKVAGDASTFEDNALQWQYEASADLPGLPMFTRVPIPNSISGTINDAGSSPLTGMSVHVRAVLKSDGSEAASTTTNPANGTYTLTGLPYNTDLAVVASDEDPDTDGYPARYYNNVGNLEWAESIVLTSGSPDRTGVDINLSTGSVNAEQLTFNTREERILNDVQIRQAIAYSTDRQSILDNAFVPNGETGEILHSLVMPGLWYKAATSDPLLTVYDYNPSEAGSILAAAGWTDTDEDGVRENASNQELVLDFVTTNAGRRVASANLFKTQMVYIGILVNIHTYSSSDFFSGDPARSPLASGDFDIAEFAWGLSDDDALPGLFNTSDVQNFGGYSNAMLDGYFNAARAAKVAGDSSTFEDNALSWQYETSADLPGLPMFTRVPIPNSISGTINDASGSPLTGVSVQVRAVLKSDGSQAAVTTTNPANGTYTLTGLPFNTELAVVASDEDPDTDGYLGEYYNQVGNLEWAESIVLTSGSPDRSGVNINLLTEWGPSAEQLTFNVRAGRLLYDWNIRQAIAYGTDRQSILENAFWSRGETGEILHSMVAPGLWYKAASSDPQLTVYDYNPTKAGSILDAAGWATFNIDGYRENASHVELVLDFVTTNIAKRVASADLFKTQMADIGILVNIHIYPPGDFFSGDPARSPLNSGDFDIAEFAWVLNNDDTLVGIYNTGDVQNYGGFSDASLDGYFNAARDAKVAGESSAFKDSALYWQYITSADLPGLPMFTRVLIPMPPVPTNVQASDGTSTEKVVVSWDASSGATSYQVYRATSELGAKDLLGSPTGLTFDDSTATPGVIYTYWVIACTGVVCSDYSAFDTGWRQLSPPTNVQASDGTYTDKVLVTWDASSGATSYNVYRATSELGVKDLLGSPTGLTFDDTTATIGITYTYWVSACTGSICIYSASDTGWRKPTPPTNVQASDGTYTDKVLVSWTASNGATSYKVYRATSAAGAKSPLGSPTDVSFNDTTATPGILYYYWVMACNGVNCSDTSAYDTGWRKPIPPTNVQASDGTYTDKVVVSWTASSGATSYRIYRATSIAGAKSFLGNPAAGTSFNDITATPGVIYTYWVKACAGLICSDFSIFDSGWRKPIPPTNVQASDGTFTGSVLVSWNTYSGMTSFKVYRASSAAGAKSLLGSSAGTTFKDNTAAPGVTYYYWVMACNGANCSDYGSYNTGWSKPNPPTNIQASDGTYADRVSVSWTASIGATSFKVYRATSAAGAKSLLGSPTGTSFNDTTATPGVKYYYYWVMACNGANCSDYSASNPGWRAVVSAPTSVQASDGMYANKVLVTWTASSGATSYQVYRALTATGTKTLIGSPSGTSFNDSSALVGVTYYYWVVAFNGIGYSGLSTSDTGWQSHISAPTNVQASDGWFTDKVLLSWTGSSGATFYDVYRAESADGVKFLLGSPNGTSFNDTNATVGVTYYYWVVARYGTWNSGYSAFDTGWRKHNPPTNVQASDGAYTDKVQVTWTLSVGATSYKVYRDISASGSGSLLASPTSTIFNDTSATPGVTYYYWVKACNGANCSDSSSYDRGWRKPTPPTNVQASNGTFTDKVVVQWTASSGATSYGVFRALSASGTKILLGSRSGTIFIDTTATPGVTYYYWVMACNGANCSDYSTYATGLRKP